MKKRIKRVMENDYGCRIFLIIFFFVLGLISTIDAVPEIRMCFVGMAIVGIMQGIGAVIISIKESKISQKPFIVILDLLFTVCVYAFAYTQVFMYNNASFNISTKIIFLDFLYYSFITLTTTGYGDILPVSYLAKFLSASESFMFACVISFSLMNFAKSIQLQNESKNDKTRE